MSEQPSAVLEAPPRRFQRYWDYKDSGVDWLGEIPAHWQLTRLKSTVTASQNGVWGDEPNGEDDIVCVRVADFDRLSLRVDMSNPTRRSMEPRIAREHTLVAGDLLLEKSGGGDLQPVGTVVVYDHAIPAVCSNFIARMPVADGFVPRFLAYLHFALYAARINIRSIKQSTGIQNLDSDAYLGELAAIPGEAEQSVIASFLDRETAKIDALVAKKQQAIELLQEKRAAVVTKVVTRGLDSNTRMKHSGIQWLDEIPAHWAVRRIATAVQKITNGYVGPTRDILVNEGVRYLQSLHIKGGSIDFERRPYYVSEDWSAAHAKSILHEGDVLIVQTGDIGQVCVVPTEFAGSNCHALIILRLKPGLGSGAFLSFLLQSSYGQNALRWSQTGALHPHLECGHVREIPIILPPAVEQDEIVRHLEERTAEIDRLIAKVGSGVDCLKEFRNALISAAVTGKIDVREEAA